MPSSRSTPLLVNRCQLPQRSLWFGQAALYADRVHIRGWHWSGRYRRIVPLERIDEVKWWAVTDEVNVLLRLDDGGGVPLQLRSGAGTWNVRLHQLLGESLLRHHKPPTAPQSPATVPRQKTSGS